MRVDLDYVADLESQSTHLTAEVERWKGLHESSVDAMTAHIARLTAEVERWKKAHKDACDLAERHMDEKHRLRAALEEIVALPNPSPLPLAIARAALKEPAHDWE